MRWADLRGIAIRHYATRDDSAVITMRGPFRHRAISPLCLASSEADYRRGSPPFLGLRHDALSSATLLGWMKSADIYRRRMPTLCCLYRPTSVYRHRHGHEITASMIYDERATHLRRRQYFDIMPRRRLCVLTTQRSI